jgi:hypothetical protein
MGLICALICSYLIGARFGYDMGLAAFFALTVLDSVKQR